MLLRYSKRLYFPSNASTSTHTHTYIYYTAIANKILKYKLKSDRNLKKKNLHSSYRSYEEKAMVSSLFYGRNILSC